jgi:hypothetical protein
MGLFDLLRGVVPSEAHQIARYPWNVSSNPAPSWLFNPAAYDWSDVAGPISLPDFPDKPDAASAVPLIDRPDPTFDDIHAELLAGAASRIGPEHFALNPDNWTHPIANPSAFGPYWARASEPFGSGVSQPTLPATVSKPDVAPVPRIGDADAAVAQNSLDPIYSSSAGPVGQAAADTRDENSGDEKSGDKESGDPASWPAAHAALNIGSFIPGPIGSLAALGDAGLSLKEGDWLGAGIGGIGALAGIASDAGGVKAALEATRLAAKAAAESKGARDSFDSARAIKRYLGPAGDGKSWHHIVEESKTDQFGPQAIHTFDNMVPLPNVDHHAISGFFSSSKDFSEGQRVRDWLRGQSFDQQHEFGLKQLRKIIGD